MDVDQARHPQAKVVVPMGLVLSMVAALIAGIALGLFTFRLKQRWCPACGATLACPDSAHHAEHLR